MNVGTRIKEIRMSKKMTQQDFANLLFVTDKTISSWESNRTEPSIDLIVKISEVLDCSPSYLIYGDVNKSDIETEIKIKLSEKEYKYIENTMNSNANFIKMSNQLDTYYEPTYRSFIEGKDVINEWLRIGRRGKKTILTYKNWYDVYCDEYEVELDDAKNMDRILKILGLKEIAVVDKVRKTYFYLDKYEVALDYVKGLGYYIEIEVKKYDKEAVLEYDDLLRLVKELNLDLKNIDKRGYPYNLIMQSKN